MPDFILKIWSTFRGSVRRFDSSRQLALGIMFGMCTGMIPKDSLLPYGFLILLMLTTANLTCAIISGFAFTAFTWIATPITDRVGHWVLSLTSLEPLWARIYEMPLIGWTRFENTVVMGSLVLAMAMAIPVYHISFYFFELYGKSFYRRVANTQLRHLFSRPHSASADAAVSNLSHPELAGSEN